MVNQKNLVTFIIRTGEVSSIGWINKNRDIDRYILNDYRDLLIFKAYYPLEL